MTSSYPSDQGADALINCLPANSPEPITINGETMFSLAQVSHLTGLGRRSLQVYASQRRCNVFRGPKPSRVPGIPGLLYREADVRAYLSDSLSGAPGDPNGDAPEVL